MDSVAERLCTLTPQPSRHRPMPRNLVARVYCLGRFEVFPCFYVAAPCLLTVHLLPWIRWIGNQIHCSPCIVTALAEISSRAAADRQAVNRLDTDGDDAGNGQATINVVGMGRALLLFAVAGFANFGTVW